PAKILFLTSHSGLIASGRFYRALETEALERLYRDQKGALEPALEGKCRYALYALKNGTSRVHILNGLEAESLLKELFSSVGVGTLFYNNEYQKIRWARPADAQALFDLTRGATESEELTQRSLREIEEGIGTYFLYEIDGYILACGCLIGYPDLRTFEVASLVVKPGQSGKGLGTKLVKFAGETAAKRGGKRLIALSTQTFPFFTQKCGFKEGSIDALPVERAELLLSSRRNSRVLIKDL
ncbi:MAG: GNAT family N-acetyltransferase, partial [Opitutae bacterium]|nr:GNAT family N-acetyltransferase [Opitutae bacterium]